MYVPLQLDQKPWGSVELCFAPLNGAGVFALAAGSLLPLALFVMTAGFLCTYLYLRGVLRHADAGSAKVIPQRIRDTLNTVAEGILVLDRDQRIALANEAFAQTVGQTTDALQGQKASSLPWTPCAPSRYPWVRAIREGVAQRGAILGLRTKDSGRARKV